MNTFFFGYLSLKWRRLIRTLCVIIALPWLFYLWDTANLTATNPKLELHEILFYFSLIIELYRLVELNPLYGLLRYIF